jgi:hypothetical protein
LNSNGFSPAQIALINKSVSGSIFLEGPAGSGKTTAGVGRLLRLLEQGVPGEEILILVPQRTLGGDYYEALLQPDLPAGGLVNIVTLGGLAQRMVALFWPVIAQLAGFTHPRRPPIFLTLETAQYYLARLITPLLEEGYFESLRIDPNRLMSQILDNLNKAAVVGFPYTTTAERLKAAWVGDPAQNHLYDQAQECADIFRKYCLENNLLDFSLQLEVFTKTLWPSFICREYLFRTYRHLIFDNVEEDVPVVHDVISQWLPEFDSALLIYDRDAGYRTFLGADPQSGYDLGDLCQERIIFNQSCVVSDEMEATQNILIDSITRQYRLAVTPQIKQVLTFCHHRFYPEMTDWVSQETARLVNDQGIPPGEISILAPFMTDTLRFTLMNCLEKEGLPVHSHRPSRSLRDEPATACLLTLAALAHPKWKLPHRTRFDVRYALMQAIEGLDLVRADILSQIVYREKHPDESLTSFDRIRPDMQQRITYRIGEQYSKLQEWLAEYRSGEPVELDIFLSQLFGEVLSQPGFAFHKNFDSAAVTARLIESIQKFRWGTIGQIDGHKPVGEEYILMVEKGIMAAQYLQSWRETTEDAILLAPAYTFLMSNRNVHIQFWLDVGSQGWWERLFQPLTHPYVLSRRWPEQSLWTDAHDYQANQQALVRQISGLMRRCRSRIYLCTTGVNEQGSEQHGPLLQALQGILRRLSAVEGIR